MENKKTEVKQYEREKIWKNSLKIGAIALVLLLLVGGVFAGSVSAALKEKINPPLEESKQTEQQILKTFKELERLEKIKGPQFGISQFGTLSDTGCDVLFGNVCNTDWVYFTLADADFEGIYISVWNGSRVRQGSVIGEHTYTTYYNPNQILSVMRGIHNNNQISVHIKYFVQGRSGSWAYIYKNYEWFWLGSPKWIELWSEANYNYAQGSWEKYGWPDDSDGGANRIKSRGYVYTKAGNAYHLGYPWLSIRSFGNPELELWSNFLHQYAIQY